MTKILVIEDDIVIKNSIIDILKEESFQAIDASNGCVGLRLAKEHFPDLILCDIRMPNMNGYEVLKTLKDNYLTSWIPFIFITSKTNRASRRKGMELGADDYITKPFTPQELLTAIAVRSKKSSVLDRHQYFNAQSSVRIRKFQEIFDFDRVTNLSSRLLLQGKFEELIKNSLLENAVISGNKRIKLKIPILCLKIQNFARISKLLTDFQANTLLKQIAEHITFATLTTEITVYLGRGVFVIILPSVNRRKDVIPIVDRIQQTLDSAFDWQTRCRVTDYPTDAAKISLKIATGISFYPDYATDLPTSIEQARESIPSTEDYGSWRRYLNSHRKLAFYRPKSEKYNIERLIIKKELPNALALKEFRVYYQPQIELETSRVISADATLAWQHPIYGKISAQKFIPVASDMGKIVPLSLWLLNEACQQSKKWQQQGFSRLKLTLPIFHRHFEQNTFTLDILKLIQKYELNYDSLQLEVSENILLQNPQQAKAKLTELSNLGVKIVLDNFATGYTNLNYWRELPLNSIRLDWHQLQTIYHGDRPKQIVEAATALAHYRGIDTIVKGIATQTDWDLLRQQCDLAQGSYFSPPLAATKFSQLLSKAVIEK